MSIEQTLMQIYSAEPEMTPMGMAEGGEVSQEEMLMQAMEGEAEAQANPDDALRSTIEELMAQASQAEDPAERDKYLHLAEAAEIGSQAPMGEMAVQLAQAGRGEDTALAHVRPGEVIIPPEAFEDPEFESLIEKKFEELDIDPSRMVVGVGIASLNPITGLEEFGFFKKLAKSVKKVVKKVIKPIAKVAQFIPGPWQPIAAMANKAFTVYDVAKGRASPLDLLTMGKGVPTGGGGSGGISSLFGGAKEFLTKGKDGVGLFGNISKGIGGLFTGGGKDKIGSFGRMGDFFGGIGDAIGVTDYAGMAAPGYGGGQFPIGEGETAEEAMNRYYSELPESSPERQYIEAQMPLIKSGIITPEEIMGTINQDFGAAVSAASAANPADTINKYLSENPDKYEQINQMISSGMTEAQIAQRLLGGSAQAGQGGFGGLFSGGGADGVGNYGVVGDLLGGFTDKLGLTNYGGGAGGDSGRGGGFNLGGMGGVGVAALLAKLAYDQAKNDKGVQLTPAMTMNKYGGYQMAKRDAAAAGEAAPDPIDYGLLPSPMPMLSGGRQAPAQEEQAEGMRYGGAVMPQQMRYGGMVPMAYAEGGNVATEDFKRKNGGINGQGTETSDDIPAMLSDGEFVMTGQAVRGAGSFDLQSDGGIITLTPNGGESREKGTQLMYEMMDLFAEFADKPKSKRAKAA